MGQAQRARQKATFSASRIWVPPKQNLSSDLHPFPPVPNDVRREHFQFSAFTFQGWNRMIIRGVSTSWICMPLPSACTRTLQCWLCLPFPLKRHWGSQHKQAPVQLITHQLTELSLFQVHSTVNQEHPSVNVTHLRLISSRMPLNQISWYFKLRVPKVPANKGPKFLWFLPSNLQHKLLPKESALHYTSKPINNKGHGGSSNSD